jgi:hypothetical protein
VAGLAGKPVGYIIAPILGWTGEGNVVRVSAEVGAYPGSVVPSAGNRGLLLPLQSGQVSDGAEDRRIQILDAGGAEGAEWVWRYQSETGTDWRGADDVRYMTGYSSPSAGLLPGSDDCSLCYSSLYRRVIFVSVDSTTNPNGPSTVHPRTIDLDSQGYREWTSQPTFDLEGAPVTSGPGREIAPDFCNTRMVELADGTILLAVRVRTAANFDVFYDFDIYHSLDGGESWEKVADGVLAPSRGLADFAVGFDSESQFALARSGDVLRLTWVAGGAGEFYSAESTDRGVSWTAIPDSAPPALFDNGDPSNPYVFDVCDLDGRGRFLMVGVTTARIWQRYSATAGNPFVSISFGGSTMNAEPVALFCERALGWVWVWAEVSDRTGGSLDEWYLTRSVYEEAGSSGLLGQWEVLDPAFRQDKSLYISTRGAVVWAGDRFYFAAGNKDHNSGVEINLASAWTATLGWNKRTLGIIDYGASWADDSNFGGTSVPLLPGSYLELWQRQWNVRQGEPSVGGGGYTRTTVGTTAWSLNMTGGFISTTGVGSQRIYDYVDASGTEPWGGDSTGLARAFGSCFEFVTGVSSGSPLVDEYVIEIQAPSSTSVNMRQIRIRIYGTTVDVLDVVASTVRASLTVPYATTLGGTLRIRWWWNTGAGFSGQLAVIDAEDPEAEWIVSPVASFSSTSSGTIQNRLRFGNLGNTQAGTIQTRWVEVSYNGRDTLRQGTLNNYGVAGQTGFVNPDYLLGFSARSGEEVEVGDGLSVALAGAGGAQGDEFLAEIEHTHAGENVIAKDSPRIDWRVPQPTNELSSPLAFAGSEWTKNVSGATNTVADNSQTAPDGTLTASEVTYTRATGGSAIYLRANGGDQSPEATLAPTAPRRGWTFSIWVRNRSGFDVALTMDVSDGPGAAAQTVQSGSGWQRLRFNVSTNGNASGLPGWLDIVIGGYVGGTLVVLDLWGAKLTADPELVLAYSSEQSAGQLIDATAVAVFGCNARRLAIDTDDNVNFDSPAGISTLDLARYGTEATPLSGTGSPVGRGVAFVPPPTGIIDREISGQYLYCENGEGWLRSARITRYRDLSTAAIAHLDNLVGADASGFIGSNGPSDEFVVYGESGAVDTSTGLLDSYVRIRILEQETPRGEDNFRIGNVVLGVRKDFGVPLEWSYTDNKQPNVTSYRTRSAVAWAYREGPPQRTYTSRFVGDTTQRWRENLRFLLDEIEYEVRPLAVVLDEDRANETAVLGRIVSGSENDNAMWFEDAQGVKRTAGDLSITIVEEV